MSSFGLSPRASLKICSSQISKEPSNKLFEKLGRALDFGLRAFWSVALSAYRSTSVIWSFAGACRFYPSCSQYAEAALRGHGGAAGTILILKRICRCHPLSKQHGYDPVPQSHKPVRKPETAKSFDGVNL